MYHFGIISLYMCVHTCVYLFCYVHHIFTIYASKRVALMKIVAVHITYKTLQAK